MRRTSSCLRHTRAHVRSEGLRHLAHTAFTLLELLAVVAIISLLTSILLPALSQSRSRSRATVCLANLKNLGQGLVMYADFHSGQLLPGRLPKLDNDHWQAYIHGGWKYRPTFLAMMGTNVGIEPFEHPMASKNAVDHFGQKGNRQNYSSPVYVCPEVSDWTDERNGSYGYNYQFLGNSRLRNPADPFSFKNWPVSISRILRPALTVAVGDCLGTAAAFPDSQRGPYSNNSRDPKRLGNEGFNLDPPKLDLSSGEIADSNGYRSAAHARHIGKANILWVDGHASAETMNRLGYRIESNGVVATDGDNMLWSEDGTNKAWTSE